MLFIYQPQDRLNLFMYHTESVLNLLHIFYNMHPMQVKLYTFLGVNTSRVKLNSFYISDTDKVKLSHYFLH